MKLSELGSIFFLQLFVIIAACRAVGWLTERWLKQPRVVGEMLAGVVLGPSLFGLVAPTLQQAIFPPESKGVLYACAQLGIGLYMFIVGLGFRSDHFRANSKSAIAVSVFGMAAPFAGAILLVPWLLNTPGLFPGHPSPLQATLFMGAAISITAFPMLARIIHERGLNDTRLGTLVLSAGAVDDAGAWIVLAIVLATFSGDAAAAWRAVTGCIGFAVCMIAFGPRLLAPLGQWAERDRQVGPTLLSVVLLLFMLAAYAMDRVGVHAVFGGFILGAAMPRGRLASELRRQLEPFTLALLLPIFFAYSGLNTRLTLLTEPALAPLTAAILVVSVAGKAGACWLAARITGQDNRTSLGIASLMNTRGLMELIILNIGMQERVISPALFSMMVLMTVLTTLMTTPLFELVYGRRARALGELPTLAEPGGGAAAAGAAEADAALRARMPDRPA
ncbi:cation:proton antiporter [Burkholderia sp. FERM BP-3421]|uniref:cation:proton antiporter n=1 Tax=Burkholderia sp. FERM BP-3421 TaxID=1494466 RepID=UPI0023607B41|nr:cation:proton antiporter [Burkholderia sp. FERM BP-3421]WDD92631.1 cation:proton antiporter [Burkholderia sp. FERM BP-3421]